MFFDQYPRFLTTSQTANNPQRLGIRHLAMFRHNQALFSGSRVLDIASHDGRWTFAALHARAAHATGIEVRPELVKNAEENFAHYGVSSERYQFVNADVFEVLARPQDYDLRVDVVMCLGFIYHTLRYPELFQGIRALDAKHLLIDTAVYPDRESVVKVFAEDIGRQRSAGANPQVHAGRMLTGRPSASALELMLSMYGFEVIQRYDWAGTCAKYPNLKAISAYRNGRRVTWLCRTC